MRTHPSKSIVAEELAEVLHTVLHSSDETSSKESNHHDLSPNKAVSVFDLTEKLIHSDFVEIGTDFKLPDIHVSSGIGGNEFVIKRFASNISVYWKWTEEKEESHLTKCISFILNIGDVNLHLSKVCTATKEDTGVPKDNTEKSVCYNETMTEEPSNSDAKSLFAPDRINKTMACKELNYCLSDGCGAFESIDIDSILGNWLSEMSPLTEIRVGRLRITTQPEISYAAIQSLIFPMMNTGILGLSLTNFEPLVIITSISISLPSHNTVGLNMCLNGCSFRSSVWCFDDVQVIGTILGYDITLEASTMMLSFKSNSFTGSLKELTNLEVKEQGYYLKVPMQVVSLLFNGICLEIKCASGLSLGKKLTEYQASQEEIIFHLPFCVRLIFPSITLEMDGQRNPEHTLRIDNMSLYLEPVFKAQKYNTRTSLRLSSLCYCGWLHVEKLALTGFMDETCTTIHDMNSSISSVHFNVDKSSKDWLDNINDMIHLDRLRGIELPYAHMESFRLVASSRKKIFAKKYETQFVEFYGEADTTFNSMAHNYTNKLHTDIKVDQQSNREFRSDMADQVAIAAGAAILGASVVTPVGAAVSVASLGVRDGVGNAVKLGKESRGASEDDSYNLGDATRGIVTMARGAVSRLSAQKKGRPDSSGPSITSKQEEGKKDFILKDKVRLAAVGGMSFGGAIGMGVCAAAGPILSPAIVVSAASFVGYNAAKSAMQKKDNGPLL